MSKKRVDHYQIVYENERKVKYGIFNSTNLDVLGQIYARMLQFETMFETFPNASCRLILEKDYNYDPDLGSFRMEDVIGSSGYDLWAAFTEEIVQTFRYYIEIPVSPCDMAFNRKSRHESLAEDLCDNGDG